MLKKIFSGQINSITLAALLVALSSLISRILGIFRDRILAGQFGAGDNLDIYYAAFRIPDLVFNLLILGALSAGFIPIFTNLIKKYDIKDLFCANKRNEAWQLASNILNILGFSLLVISIFGIFFAPLIIKLIVPGFSDDKQILTAGLSRIMFLSPIFLGFSSVIGGVLQSFKRFFVYSLSPIFYNVGIIIGALFFVPIWGIYGLAWGVVFGSFLHLLIQVPTILQLGFKYSFIFNWRETNVKKIMSMMIPRTFSLAISQINLLITTIIASTLVSGSITVFNFANNLQSFPIGIFGISFAIAAFPAMSAMAFDRKKLIETFSSTFRQILFFIVPSTILLIALRAQIVRVILGTGQFDWQATVLTMNILAFFSISLFAQALIPLQVRVFYARHNSSIPFYVGLITAFINIVLSYYLSKSMGVAGLALAFSIANILNFVFLWVILKIEIGSLDEKNIIISSSKFIVAGLAGGLAAQAVKQLIFPFINMERFWGVFTQGLTAGLSCLIIYLFFCSIFRCSEFFDFWSAIKKRLPWKKVEVDDQGEARGI